MDRIKVGLYLSAVFVSAVVVAGSSMAYEPGFKESLEQLKLLYTPAVPADGGAPERMPARIESTDDGKLVVKQNTVVDRPEYHFTSESEQTWTVNPAELDYKRIKVQSNPLGVYVAVKKDANRVMVDRNETKTRAANADRPGEEKKHQDTFATNFVVIPASTPDQADRAAELLKQIIRTAPKPGK